MAVLKSRNGTEILVDDDLFEKLSQYTWIIHKRGRVTKRGYAVRFDKNHKYTQLHQEVIGKKEGMVIDHINGDALDNRRENLRHCTQGENSKNQRLASNNNSGVKGVYWHKGAKKWHARIYSNGTQVNLGLFSSLLRAKEVYNKAAQNYHKEYANLN